MSYLIFKKTEDKNNVFVHFEYTERLHKRIRKLF